MTCSLCSEISLKQRANNEIMPMAYSAYDHRASRITREQIKLLHSQFNSPDPDARQILQDLCNGVGLPPYEMREGMTRPKHNEAAKAIKTAIRELARQWNICLFACGVWAEGPDTVVTTQVGALPDENNDRTFGFDYVVSQFLFWVMQHCGTSYVDNSLNVGAELLSPSGSSIAMHALQAIPCIFPDWYRYGRPCPPPPHADWEQEKDMWVKWFIALYGTSQNLAKLHGTNSAEVWQGGLFCGPHWERIQQDLNNGGDKYIEHKRLPGNPATFVKPEDWNELQTREYSVALRSTFGPTGRLLEQYTDTTFQFRAIFSGPGPDIMYTEHNFRERIHESSELFYEITALLFEQRVRSAEEHSVTITKLSDTPKPLSNLFPREAEELMRRVDGLVGGNVIQVLWRNLMSSEQQPGHLISRYPSESMGKWPKPALNVRLEAQSWASNFVDYRYPTEFRYWNHDDYHSWTFSSVLRWVKSKPFVDSQSGLVMGGYYGFLVAFVTLLQYAMNVHLEQLDRAKSKDLVVTTPDSEFLVSFDDEYFKMIRFAARALLKQLADSRHVLFPPAINMLPQCRPWRPSRWLEPDKNTEEILDDSYSRALRSPPRTTIFDLYLNPFCDSGAGPSEPEDSSMEGVSRNSSPQAGLRSLVLTESTIRASDDAESTILLKDGEASALLDLRRYTLAMLEVQRYMRESPGSSGMLNLQNENASAKHSKRSMP
ncbi:hypothetical protein FRC12_020319 [Ceratobasidium sp. 428]|nr:hypothetical protein FRC12_020319 [Ceratobasidium sp. 428]